MPDRKKFPEPVRQALMQVSVPTIVSTLYRKGLRNTLMFGPRPLNPAAVKFVGPAYTVRTIPMREDMLDEQTAGTRPNLQGLSVEAIASGEVLIVAMDGETRTAFMGDIMTTGLMAKGVAGVVLDGAVSDAVAISEIDIPVFCAGNAATPVTSHRFVVELNGAVGCAGVAVLDGDVIMGDANGVVVIPAELAAEVAEIAAERELLEEFVIGKVRDGAPLGSTYPPDEATAAEFERWRKER